MEIKEILEKIAKPAYSNKKGFKNTEKLEAIEALLQAENSPFHLIEKQPHVWIFGKEPRVKEGFTPILVSSHADIVPEITAPFSKYVEDERYFKGTYDNLGTNAACVHLMLNANLPDNVFFAFTSDEETGRCKGASAALSYMKTAIGIGKAPLIFALDVTEEGYDNDRLFTVEGLHAHNEKQRLQMLQFFLETEGAEQSFEAVRLNKKDDDSVLPDSYRAKDTVEYDESVFYAQKGCTSCSLCLPVDGHMHSNSGLYVKEPVLYGYCLSLEACILTFAKHLHPSFCPDERMSELKNTRDELVRQAREIPFHKFVNYTYSSSSYDSGYYPYLGEYGGGDFGTYWTTKKRLEMEREQVPGQISLSDLDEQFNFYKEEDDSEYDETEFVANDPFLVNSCANEIFEMAEMYAPDEFEMFLDDVCYTYGFELEDVLEQFVFEIFAEVHQEYEEEYE